MATTTAKEPKTLEFFQKKLEKLRQQHNENCAKFRKAKKDPYKASIRAFYANNAERAIVLHEVADAGLEKHILDTTIVFQSGKGYESNYDLENELEVAFPQGHGDSESGQGFFYIHHSFEFAVKDWLKSRTEEGSVRASRTAPEHTGLK